MTQEFVSGSLGVGQVICRDDILNILEAGLRPGKDKIFLISGSARMEFHQKNLVDWCCQDHQPAVAEDLFTLALIESGWPKGSGPCVEPVVRQTAAISYYSDRRLELFFKSTSAVDIMGPIS